MITPGSLRSPGADTCDARFTGAGDYFASPRLYGSSTVALPRLPFGRQGFTITARLTALSRGWGVRGKLMDCYEGEMVQAQVAV